MSYLMMNLVSCAPAPNKCFNKYQLLSLQDAGLSQHLFSI
jgi:hypothetical protein